MARTITRTLFSSRTFRQSHGPYTTAAYDPHDDFPNGGDFTIRQVSTTFTDPATGVLMAVDSSIDGGATWEEYVSSGDDPVMGGQTDRHGDPLLASVGGSVPDMSDPRFAGFRLRGRLTTVGNVVMSVVADVTIN